MLDLEAEDYNCYWEQIFTRENKDSNKVRLILEVFPNRYACYLLKTLRNFSMIKNEHYQQIKISSNSLNN